MYPPLIMALNNTLGELSKIKIPGLPDCKEDNQIVLVRTDARWVTTESYVQDQFEPEDQFEPDIVLLRWQTFKEIRGGPSPLFSDTYTSDICCKSGTDQPKLNWRNLLSTLEVKRGGNEGVIRGFPNK